MGNPLRLKKTIFYQEGSNIQSKDLQGNRMFPKKSDSATNTKKTLGMIILFFFVSRPAPGRDYSCCSGIPGFEIGRGQGRGKLY